MPSDGAAHPSNTTRLYLQKGSIRNPLPPKGGLVTIGPRIGAGMVIQSWYSSGYRCTNCSQFLTDNVTMHGSGSMGFGEFGGEGANVYRNCRNVRRPGSTHLLSSNHDGFHSYAVAVRALMPMHAAPNEPPLLPHTHIRPCIQQTYFSRFLIFWRLVFFKRKVLDSTGGNSVSALKLC